MPDAPLILLFVKAPVRGSVKSRLAAVLGNAFALDLYRAFVQDMLDTIDGTGLACRICVHPPDALPSVSSWLGAHRRYLPQAGKDLGERMENASVLYLERAQQQAWPKCSPSSAFPSPWPSLC